MAGKVHIPSKVCDLCCHESNAWAIGECDHPTCLNCSAKLRVLCDQKECPVCRLKLSLVLVVGEVKSFSTYSLANFIQKDRKYRISFETADLGRFYDSLRESRCTKCNPGPVFRTFKQLRDHVNRVHDLHYCDICVEHLKLFPPEFKMYTRPQLTRHRREGDISDTSHKGHPICKFCDDRYLDNDALHVHLRTDHFWCHICESEGRQDYYKNYLLLRKHFKDEHNLCEEGACREEKYTTVFRSKIDLQAHRATTHTKGLSKAEVRQLKQLELGFSYGGGRDEGASGGVRSRGGGGYVNPRSGRTAQIREREELDVATALSVSTQPSEVRKKPKRQSPPLKKSPEPSEEPKAPPGFAKVVPTKLKVVRKDDGAVEVNSNGFNPYAKENTIPEPVIKDLEVSKPPGFKKLPVDQRKEREWPEIICESEIAAPKRDLPSESELAGLQAPSFRYGGPSNAWAHAKPSEKSLKTKYKGENEMSKKIVGQRTQESMPVSTGSGAPTYMPEAFPPMSVSMALNIPSQKEVNPDAEVAPSRKSMESKVVEKIRSVLGKDKAKFTQFKTLSGWYRNSEITAPEYSAQCSSLFGASWDEIGPQVAAVYPEESKKKELLTLFGFRPQPSTKQTSKSKKKTKGTTVWASRMPATSHVPKRAPAQGMLNETEYPTLAAASTLEGPKVNSGQGAWNMIIRS